MQTLGHRHGLHRLGERAVQRGFARGDTRAVRATGDVGGQTGAIFLRQVGAGESEEHAGE